MKPAKFGVTLQLLAYSKNDCTLDLVFILGGKTKLI